MVKSKETIDYTTKSTNKLIYQGTQTIKTSTHPTLYWAGINKENVLQFLKVEFSALLYAGVLNRQTLDS